MPTPQAASDRCGTHNKEYCLGVIEDGVCVQTMQSENHLKFCHHQPSAEEKQKRREAEVDAIPTVTFEEALAMSPAPVSAKCETNCNGCKTVDCDECGDPIEHHAVRLTVGQKTLCETCAVVRHLAEPAPASAKCGTEPCILSSCPNHGVAPAVAEGDWRERFDEEFGSAIDQIMFSKEKERLYQFISELLARERAASWQRGHDEACKMGTYCSAHQPPLPASADEPKPLPPNEPVG